MTWLGKRVVVTGCSGLIGAPLCQRLAEAGAEVVGYDKAGWGLLQMYGLDHGQVALIAGDILDIGGLRRVVHKADAVFHLAAVSGVEESRNSPLDTYRINVMGTVNVLEAARLERQPPVVILASSNHVYGQQFIYPTREEMPLRQLDTYSASKIAMDYIGRSYAHSYQLPVAVVRNTNCFSPYDPHLEHIVPATILALIKGEVPVIKSDGRRRKAYLYVDDVASAYTRVAEILSENLASFGEAFNVSGPSISVLELVQAIIGAYGASVLPVVEGQANDQNDEFLDCSKITALGWHPKYRLSEALAITIAGFKERFTMKETIR